MYQGIIHQYQQYLPIEKNSPIISLFEGQTPLFPLKNLDKMIGKDIQLWAKFDGLNPTGSFKDRGMTMAVTKAFESGAHSIICASTGNTSASAAAYAAKAKMNCFVVIPSGKIAYGKLVQAFMYGAKIIQIEDNFDVGMSIVKKLSHQGKVVLVNSVNPNRLQGQKTAAFEIVDDLGLMPDYHCLPVGNAGNITAYWLGYSQASGQSTSIGGFLDDAHQYHQYPFSKNHHIKRPKMLGYQAQGASPFTKKTFEDHPETVATAIRIGHPQSWEYAWKVKEESNGWFASCSDEEILKTQKLLAEKEGIFCEPASAVSIAGMMLDVRSGKIEPGSKIVCTLTGNGLKDVQTPIEHIDIKQHITHLKSADIKSFENFINQSD